MATSKTISVPHLGGMTAGYRATDLDPAKPTIVLVNSFMTSTEFFDSQFESSQLTTKCNLLAIEPLGHGNTRAEHIPHFTYWDSAMVNLQVMDALKVDKAFALGTSQGGWIVARMALLAPERILGIIPLGSSMDSESAASIERGCWDGPAVCSPLIDGWSTPASPDPDSFLLADGFCSFLLNAGFGPASESAESKAFRSSWTERLKKMYAGDAGRRRARMSSINLRDRDGLYGRVGDITCPVLWMHGTEDAVYSVANAKEEIQLFTGVKDGKEARLVVVEGGHHFLSRSHPAEVEKELLPFVEKYSKA